MEKYLRFLGPAILVVALALNPVWGYTQTGQPVENNKDLQSLINDLKKSVDDADKRMVAHPTFIEELRALIKRYQDKIRHVFFFDDFTDGEFAQSPKWVVGSGKFTVTANYRLRSQVGLKAQPEPEKSARRERSREQAFGLLLQEILQTPKEDNSAPKPAGGQKAEEYEEKAEIAVETPFAAVFEVDISFTAEPSKGAMEIVAKGGDENRPRYRLVYNANPSKDRPIELVRDSGGRSYVIAAATEYPNLEDGQLHRIQWIRDVQGNMTVLVDGQAVLYTVEVYYREPFNGLGLINRGGTYEWDSIRIIQPQKDQSK